MTTQAFYGCLQWILFHPFLKSILHQTYFKHAEENKIIQKIYLFSLIREGKKSKSGVPRLASSVYMPFRPHSRSDG